MAMFYPRKQTLIIFVICMLSVMGTAFYVKRQSFAQAELVKNELLALANNKIESKSAIIDTANLPDWQEQFKDVSKKPAATADSSTNQQKVESIPKTQTDFLSRDLFTKYVELKQANLLNNTEIVNQINENLLTAHVTNVMAKTYSASDLRIAASTDFLTLNSYSQKIGSVIESYSATKSESEIIQTFAETEDTESLKGIDANIKEYKKIISALLNIETPKVMVEGHLNLIDAFSTLLFAAEALRVIDTDGIRSLPGINAHVVGIQDLTDTIIAMHDDLKALGVDFNFDQSVLNILLK